MANAPSPASFDAQRHFVANASHELRTPLAGQRTLLQVALNDPAADADSLRAVCEEALHLGEQQERLIEALLTLATSERGVERWESVDLAAIAGDVITGRQHEARPAAWTPPAKPASDTATPTTRPAGPGRTRS